MPRPDASLCCGQWGLHCKGRAHPRAFGVSGEGSRAVSVHVYRPRMHSRSPMRGRTKQPVQDEAPVYFLMDKLDKFLRRRSRRSCGLLDQGVTSPLGFGSVHAAPGADRGSYREIEPFSMRLRHLNYVCACLFLAGTRGYITTKAEVLEEEVSKRKTVVSSLDAAPVNLLSTS